MVAEGMAVKDIATEKKEAMKLMQWARLHPLIKHLIFKINNEGSHSSIHGYHNKLEGILPGVSDYMLPLARGSWHGLFLELKREKGYTISPAQLDWVKRMRENGYAAGFVFGADHAIRVIERYLVAK